MRMRRAGLVAAACIAAGGLAACAGGPSPAIVTPPLQDAPAVGDIAEVAPQPVLDADPEPIREAPFSVVDPPAGASAPRPERASADDPATARPGTTTTASERPTSTVTATPRPTSTPVLSRTPAPSATPAPSSSPTPTSTPAPALTGLRVAAPSGWMVQTGPTREASVAAIPHVTAALMGPADCAAAGAAVGDAASATASQVLVTENGEEAALVLVQYASPDAARAGAAALRALGAACSGVVSELGTLDAAPDGTVLSSGDSVLSVQARVVGDVLVAVVHPAAQATDATRALLEAQAAALSR